MPFVTTPLSPNCPKCDRAVYAAEEKIAGGFKWHKICFKCSQCNKRLDSTTCAEHDRSLYCVTCYGRQFGPKGVGFGIGAGTLSMDSGPPGEENTNGHNIPTVSENVIKAPEGKGCPRCGGYVYHADQVFSKGNVWHKQCFKCATCHRTLDSRIACDGPDNDVYCTGCYRKQFGIKGYGFGQGGPALMSGDLAESTNTVPSTAKFIDTSAIQAPPGKGCPRCGGQVFHAEQMFSKGNIYHKKCFSCYACKRPLDSVLACDAPDGNIYCKGCYARTFGAKGYGFGGGSGFLQCGDIDDSINDRPTLDLNTTSIRGDPANKDTCPRCGGIVFHAERMLSKSNSFHKKCFTCFECKKPLDSTSCNDAPNGEIFCKACYGKNFGPKGYGFAGSNVPAMMAGEPGQFADDRVQMDFMPLPKNGAPRDPGGCLRCGYAVYEAEKLIAAGRNWHKRCFACSVCKRHLDSTTVNDGPDGDIYCRTCYAAKFGMKGYGYGHGAGTLMSDGLDARNTQISAETAFILP